MKQEERLDRLDGLRGLAALAVLVSHSAADGYLPRILGHGLGQMGVALFYALSAFLLAHLYLHREFSGDGLRAYAIARVARVLPLFYAMLALAGAALLTGTPILSVTSVQELIQSAALIHAPSVLWSVPVELQFYLIFIGLWWLRAQRGWGLWRLAGAGLALQVALLVAIWLVLPGHQATILPYWLHLFIAGVALVHLKRAPLTRRALPLQALALVALVLFAMPEMRRALGFSPWENYRDPLTLGVPLLLLYLTLREAAPLRFLTWRPFRWLGGISFGLYLLHLPVISLVRRSGAADTWPGAAFPLILAGSLAAAWLARQLIELPAQRWLREALNEPRRRVARA